MDLLTFILVFIIGFSTAIIGIIVGSSGLIRIPLLILLGIPPQISVATNKVGSIGISIVGLYRYGKEKLIDLKIGFSMVSVEIFGAIIGSYILLSISGGILKKIIGLVIFGIVFLIIIKKNVGLKKIKEIPRRNWIIGAFLFFIVAIYGGFIGGGGGTIQTYILISMFGLTFLESAATRRIPNLIGALTSVSIFAFYGIINWPVGIVLLISESMGAWVGSSIAIKKGNKFVKILFVIVAIALAIKLLLT